MADAIAGLIIYGLSIDYLQLQEGRLLRLRADEVTETCHEILAAASPRWFVVGQAAELAEVLRMAVFGDAEWPNAASARVP